MKKCDNGQVRRNLQTQSVSHLAPNQTVCFAKDMNSSLPAKTTTLTPPSLRPMRTIGALILREMSASYGNSPGGYVWAVLQPLGMVLVLSLGFSLLFSSPALGTSFTLFYATGYLSFQFFGVISQKVAFSLRYSRTLLEYPEVTWIDAVLARFILNFLTYAAIFCIVISGILQTTETGTILTLGPILCGLGVCIFMGLGVGVMNAVLFGLAPICEQIWDIINRPLFLASGVLFLYDDLPPLAQSILWWNPLMHGTGLVRKGFYPTYEAEYASLLYCLGFALTLIALGLIFLRANHKRILER